MSAGGAIFKRCGLACNRGVAAIEFALGLPVFLFLILGGVELASYALAHLRVGLIASTVADDTGRTLTGVDEYNVYEAFAGADIIGKPIKFRENGKIVLSSVEFNEQKDKAKQGQWIRWQRCWGQLSVSRPYGSEGKGMANADLKDGMGPLGKRVIAEPGTAMMFVEATYRYQPLIFSTLIEDRDIRYESAFNVRGRTNQAIMNGQRLTALTCS